MSIPLSQPIPPPRPLAGDVPDPSTIGMHPEQAAAVSQARRIIKLTDRWTNLKPHHQQALFCYHPARFKVCPAGRRSGKTELAKRKTVLQLIRRRPWPAMLFVGSPSFGQTRDIFWSDLKLLIPEAWKRSTSESRMEIVTKWGALIRLFGFDRPRRIEGPPWDHGTIDEIADAPARCVELNIRPAMATANRKGSCDYIGVPDEVGRNQAEYQKLFETGLTWPNTQDICSFHWHSKDIIPDEAAMLAGDADSLAYDQEMGGEFVTSKGVALYNFDSRYHVSARHATYDPRLPLDWSLDFGVTPACSLLCQTWGGFVWILDEIVVNDGSTEQQLVAFREKVRERGWRPRRIRIFGDAAGKGRHSPRGESDYRVLEDDGSDLPLEWHQLYVAPPIPDTLNAVRGRVKSKNGLVRLHIDPRCQLLIENCKTAPWPHKLEEFHALAALRYYAYSLFGASPTIGGTSRWSPPNLRGDTIPG